MKPLFFLTVLFLFSHFSIAQNLFIKSFGKSKNEPVIFIHGGPGSSSAAFGATTAQHLADKGYYVIIYDRRGEGLSSGEGAAYTFNQTFDDLNSIYTKFSLHKATLIGFSFGGIVSALSAERYPSKIKSLVLVSALLSQKDTYHTVLNRSKAIYQQQKDTPALSDVKRIELMDESSFEYRTNCFRHSSKNGFFSTENKTTQAERLYAQLESDPEYRKFSAQKNDKAVEGFWNNEHYSTMSIIPVLKHLMAGKMKISALYGKDDGIFQFCK